jgi:hypothetical protein
VFGKFQIWASAIGRNQSHLDGETNGVSLIPRAQFLVNMFEVLANRIFG